MLFHTWTFLLFFAVTVTGYLALARTRLWVPWLLLASYVFYGWWRPAYLILVLYSTALDFLLVAWMDRCPPAGVPVAWNSRRLWGSGIADAVLRRVHAVAGLAGLTCLAFALVGPPAGRSLGWAGAVILLMTALGAAVGTRKTWIAVSLVNNLGLLVFFKYAEFFSHNLNDLFALAHLGWRMPEPAALMPFGFDYLLPVGISFYTFQSLSYTLDFYRGEIHRERSFIRFATFVSFFPQLVAGPIERARELLPQFNRFPKITGEDVAEGFALFVPGLFKKLVLANYLSRYVERIYEDPASQNGAALAVGTIAFAWQIYCDFSGYTDMARGIARMMGFRLMLNFRNPYLASSLGDFWSRWHISLSTWFRDYVYIPLGGSRHGRWLTRRNLLITFLVSGLWHGANWTFVIWGAWHAVGAMVTGRLEKLPWYARGVPLAVKRIAVFLFVCLGWVFFRAASVSDAGMILEKILRGPWGDPAVPLPLVVLVLTVWGLQWISESSWAGVLRQPPLRVAGALAQLACVLLFGTGGGAFIYFQF